MRDTQRSSVAETSEGKDGNGERTTDRDARWAVAMADIVAHLVSATPYSKRSFGIILSHLWLSDRMTWPPRACVWRW